MTGYDAAIVEACAKVADEELAARRADLKRDLLDNFTRGQLNSTIRIAEAIRTLPIAPPAPLVTAGDAAIVEVCAKVAELLADAHEAKSLELRATGDLEDLDQSVAYARSANIRRRVAVSIRAMPIAPPIAPAVDETELVRLREALAAIQREAERENGGWIHLKRCIAVQAAAALNHDGNAG